LKPVAVKNIQNVYQDRALAIQTIKKWLQNLDVMISTSTINHFWPIFWHRWWHCAQFNAK